MQYKRQTFFWIDSFGMTQFLEEVDNQNSIGYVQSRPHFRGQSSKIPWTMTTKNRSRCSTLQGKPHTWDISGVRELRCLVPQITGTEVAKGKEGYVAPSGATLP